MIGGFLTSSKQSKRLSTKKLLDLPPDLALDLAAFCAAHYGAAATEILRRALRRFIDTELRGEPKVRERFLEARRQLGDSSEKGIRLVDGGKSS